MPRRTGRFKGINVIKLSDYGISFELEGVSRTHMNTLTRVTFSSSKIPGVDNPFLASYRDYSVGEQESAVVADLTRGVDAHVRYSRHDDEFVALVDGDSRRRGFFRIDLAEQHS
jgi:hypothetical protein